ncbi:MAG: hypothetical protein NUV78_00170 [Candidatus Zambryskibacteria bacterium]|nr:hypothetical protein [Candidatus Zambryskibacteria bacterium]
MPPKFQSSFIPKGAVVSGTGGHTAPVKKERSILGFIAMVVFALSLLAALLALGYKFYLDYSIKTMAAELDAARGNVEPETVLEITRLNNRLLSTEGLINQHVVLSPLLSLLEASTVRTVRFTDFSFNMNNKELKIALKGEASSYSNLAAQAEILKESKSFINPVFSDLALDERGNVRFSFNADINPDLVSYRKVVELTAPIIEEVEAPVETATSTPVSLESGTTTPQGN